MIRYRFSAFTLSPRQRLLIRDGQEVPLIPRYFDLLLLLIERRQEAVHRNEIFERVWTDVTVSDSALSQAVRTLRRTLGDDHKEPRFIRTVSRHGYQFVFPDIVEEADDLSTITRGPAPADATRAAEANGPPWGGAVVGATAAGVAAGGVGGLLLAIAPDSHAPFAIAPVLAVIGGGCGALGAACVAAGLAVAQARVPAAGPAGAIAGAAVGGAVVGSLVQWLSRWGLSALLGLDVAPGGALEGLAIGAAVGAAHALSPRHPASAAATMAVVCGAAGLLLTLTGLPLVGGTIHLIADAAEGSRATLAPLGRLLGEPGFGRLSSSILAFGEAATFGAGFAWGFRRRARTHHPNLT